MITVDMPNEAALKQLGARIAAYRLNKNMTQQNLATEAGLSLPTIQRLENGHSTQLENLLRVLRALNMSQNLDALIPEPVISPIQKLAMHGRKRRRASSSGKRKRSKRWSWGSDNEPG